MYWLGFYWLIGTMVNFGDIAVPLSVVFFAIIGLGNGVRLGLFAWWLRSVETAASPWWVRLVLPAGIYVTLDYLFPRVFPWYLGFLQFPAVPFIQIADLTGIHGVSFMLVACSSAVAALVPHTMQPDRSTRRWLGVTLALLLVLQGGYGLWRMRQITAAMRQAPTLRLAMVQTNIDMDEKRQGRQREERLELQTAMGREALRQQPDVIIWPESMYPYSVPTHAPSLPLPVLPENQQAHWLIGALTFTGQRPERQTYNSALLVAPDTRILGRYDKQALLAFGEYIPLQHYFPFLRDISPTIGNLTPGTGGVVTLSNGVSLGPLICYEDILPTLARKAVRQGARLLVNLTNDVWFGPTRAPYQHRGLAAFRAVENRVYLVRVTNTGLTSVIDALGRERATLPIYQQATLVHDVHLVQLPTVYTRFGDWFAQVCCGMAIGLSVWLRRRPRS
jgi:apolipoprotein N-acyltransferase